MAIAPFTQKRKAPSIGCPLLETSFYFWVEIILPSQTP